MKLCSVEVVSILLVGDDEVLEVVRSFVVDDVSGVNIEDDVVVDDEDDEVVVDVNAVELVVAGDDDENTNDE